MEPLLSSGDRILIDVSRTVPVPPGIFVIWDGMGLVAKHVEHVPHSDPPTVVLKALNPEYKSYERSVEETHIVGKDLGLREAVGGGRPVCTGSSTAGRPVCGPRTAGRPSASTWAVAVPVNESGTPGTIHH